MRKSICILAAFLVVSAVTLYGKKITHLISEKPSHKTIRFLVSATGYSAPIYNKTTANVKLTIYKFYNNRQEIVWQGVVDKGGIKNYPGVSQPLFKEVSIYNVYDRSETLAAFYEVEYTSKGSKLSYIEGINVSAGSKVDSLKISI